MEVGSSWSDRGLESLFLALASAIEICFVFGAALFCKNHYQQICQWLDRCSAKISAWRVSDGPDPQLTDEVRRLQLGMAHTFLNVLAGIGNGVTFIYQSNIWRQHPRWMPTEFILFMLPISAYATLHLFCPKQLVTRRTVNFCYALGMICGMLALSPLGSPPLKSGNLSLSLAYTAFFRLPSVTLATRTSLVLFLNVLSLALTFWRAIAEGFPRASSNAGTPLWIEGLSCVVVTLVSISLQQWLKGAASQRLHNKKMKAELSAVTSLLRLTCDAVIELGEDLKLTSHSSELAAVLLRDRPGASLEGLPLTDFMPPAEAARATELLSGVGDRDRDEGRISANVFHTRLVDTYASRFRTEVFQVRYSKIDGEVRHLIGLRDFTDQLSLAGRNATDEIPEPRRVAATRSAEAEEQQLTLLELDLQEMVVNAASASLAQLVGRGLEEVFATDGVELFRKAQQQLMALEEQKSLHEKSLFFGSLGLRCGDRVHQISGTMEPTWSRRRELSLVLCFQLSSHDAMPLARYPVAL